MITFFLEVENTLNIGHIGKVKFILLELFEDMIKLDDDFLTTSDIISERFMEVVG